MWLRGRPGPGADLAGACQNTAAGSCHIYRIRRDRGAVYLRSYLCSCLFAACRRAGSMRDTLARTLAGCGPSAFTRRMLWPRARARLLLNHRRFCATCMPGVLARLLRYLSTVGGSQLLAVTAAAGVPSVWQRWRGEEGAAFPHFNASKLSPPRLASAPGPVSPVPHPSRTCLA